MRTLDCMCKSVPVHVRLANSPIEHQVAFHSFKSSAPAINVQVVAVKQTGQTSPPSNEDIFTTPESAPILTSADAWGPTAAQATATPPPGVTYKSVSSNAIGADDGC